MKALCSSVLLLLLCAVVGCTHDKVVYLRAAPLPAETVTLEVEPQLNGKPPAGKLRFNQGLRDRVGIELPADAGGNLHVLVNALDAQGCVVATGPGAGEVKDGAEILVPMVPAQTRRCLWDDMATPDLATPTPDLATPEVSVTIAVLNTPAGTAKLHVQYTLDGIAQQQQPDRAPASSFPYSLQYGSKGTLLVHIEALNMAGQAIAGGSGQEMLQSGRPINVMLNSYDDPGCDMEGKLAACNTGSSFCPRGQRACERRAGVLRWAECTILRDASCPADGTTRMCNEPTYGCAGSQQFTANSGWSACTAVGRCECRAGQTQSCTCIDATKCPEKPNGMPGAHRCEVNGGEQYWPQSCSCGAFPNLIQCHRVRFELSNVDQSAVLFKNDGNGNAVDRVYELIQGPSPRSAVLSNVWSDLANKNLSTTQDFFFKIFNGDCGWTAGTLKVYVDGKEKLTATRVGGGSHCGWTYRKPFTVNFETGQVSDQPENGCNWPTDCPW